MKYSVQNYDQLVRQSYCFSEEKYQASEDYAVLKALYEKNYLNGSGQHKIPRKIHQIWLGSVIPNRFKEMAKSWQKFHPAWEYKLWTDKDAEEFDLVKKDFYRESPNFGQKSDILRHEILYRLGGLYVDTDFECLKSFDDLMYLDFFTSSGYSEVVELYPALTASIAGHSIPGRYIEDLTVMDTGTYKRMFETTGPYYYTRCFLKEVTKDTEGVVAFPPKFFYPWPNNDMDSALPYEYVKSYSYAIHHWAVMWTKGKRRRYGLDSR